MTTEKEVMEMVEKEISIRPDTLAISGSPCEDCLKELACRIRLIEKKGAKL